MKRDTIIDKKIKELSALKTSLDAFNALLDNIDSI